MIMRRVCIALVIVFGVAGCVSVRETGLRDKHHQAYETVYSQADTMNLVARLDATSTIDDYLSHAFAHSPKMRAAFDRWAAALERIPQARSLDNPTLSFEYFSEQKNLRYQATLEQMFPAFGKLGLRDKVTAAQAETAAHEFEAERFVVYDRVVKAFYEYHYLSRATAATADNLQLLADLEKVLTTRYGAGVAAFSELIKVQLEKDRMTSELASMKDERGARSAMLGALLNLPGHEVLPWPKVTPPGPLAIDEAVLAEMIADLNPELKAADSMIAAEEARVELAKKSYLPDFTLGASWMVMPGTGGSGDESDVSLMAGITVPIWWGRYRSEFREAAAMAKAAALDRDERRNMLRAELSMAVVKIRDADRRAALFSTSLIPKAGQALEVARQEFAAGKVDFMTLIDAQRVLLDFKLQAERAAVDREIANAEIGCCVGKFGNALGVVGTLSAEKK